MADEVVDAGAVIDKMYGALFVGDLAGAGEWCTPEAQYHPVTPLPDGSISAMPAREYLALLSAMGASQPDYRILHHERRSYGDFVVDYLRTNLGHGTMTFRLVNGLVDEIWALNADGRNTAGPF